MNQVNETLVQSCQEAVAAIQKLKNDDFNDLQSRLEWCIGSYEHDNNPEGLHAVGRETLDTLVAFKKDNPRKVNKKVIEGLEKAIG